MINFNMITKVVGRGGLVLKKHSPIILTVVGITGIITSTVLACRATLKVEGPLKDYEEKKNKIAEGLELKVENYTEKDAGQDLFTAKTQMVVGVAKLYAPAIIIGTFSIGCLVGSYTIMRKRNIGLIAAYKAIEKGFSEYRGRVIDELGAEKDREFKYGVTKVERTTIDENGVKTNETFNVVNSNDISDYAKMYNKDCKGWSESPEYNRTFLKCQQNYANDLLNSRGHVFLNEIYDMLGIPRTKAGAVVGWVKENANGDGFIDFGVFETGSAEYREPRVCDTLGEEREDFINGYRKSILLDFNVDGIVYDLI